MINKGFWLTYNEKAPFCILKRVARLHFQTRLEQDQMNNIEVHAEVRDMEVEVMIAIKVKGPQYEDKYEICLSCLAP